MKKIFKKSLKIIATFLALFMLPIVGFAQIVLPEVPIGLEWQEYVVTFFAYAASVVAITSLLNKYVFKAEGAWKQYISWGVALLVGFAAWFYNLGIFEPIKWWQTIIYAVAVGLGSNGIYDWEVIRGFLVMLGLANPKTPTDPETPEVPEA